MKDKPNYDDAMAYLNLIYRRKADIDYGHAAEVKEDLAQAEKWRTDAMGTRKANEEKKNAGPGGHHHGCQRQHEVVTGCTWS